MCVVYAVAIICDVNAVATMCDVNAVASLCDVSTAASLCGLNAAASLCDVNAVTTMCDVNAVASLCDVRAAATLCDVSASQTDLTLSDVGDMEETVSRYYTEMYCESTKSSADIMNDFHQSKFMNDDKKVKYYTGLENYHLLMIVFNFISHMLSHLDQSQNSTNL